MPRAPRQCPARDCDELITGSQRYCDDHNQPWKGPRTASSRVTSDRVWKDEIKPEILDRDNHQCQLQYPGICIGRATVVDKKKPAARRPDLARDRKNLQAACKPCNDHKARTKDRR